MNFSISLADYGSILIKLDLNCQFLLKLTPVSAHFHHLRFNSARSIVIPLLYSNLLIMTGYRLEGFPLPPPSTPLTPGVKLAPDRKERKTIDVVA